MLRINKNSETENVLRELEKIKKQLICAHSEFNNACDDLRIKAAVFRLCELEARRDLVLKEIRK